MTESEWLACTDPERMLRWLVDDHTRHPLASDRQLRCYVEACREIVNPDPGGDWGLDLDLQGELEIAVTGWVTSSMAPQLPLPLRADLLRDICGNPFAPSPLRWRDGRLEALTGLAHHGMSLGLTAYYEPVGWLTWQGGTVVRIAQQIYDSRRFEDMPVLADALEDAGATDSAILDHCRSGGVHVRGCWLIDLLTGRG